MEYKCPHCQIRLKQREGVLKLKCGICGSEFLPKDLGGSDEGESLEFARELLKAQKEMKDLAKGNLRMVNTSELNVPQWKIILSFFGVPVEEDSEDLEFPLVLGIFVALCVLAFILGPGFAEKMQLDPKHLGKFAGLSFLTYSIVHKDILHLIGNMFFIVPFIDKVEFKLGTTKTFAFIIACAISSACFHLLLDHSGLPLVGASGICFGIVTYYAFNFGNSNLLIVPPLIGMFSLRSRMRIKAWTFVMFYFMYELVGAYFQMNGGSEVSHLGHIGGALCALVFHFFL